MAVAAVRVDGLAELRRNLRRVKDRELNDEMRQIHQDIAREIIATADPPVLTGRLAASIRSSGTVRDAIGRAGGSSVPYAPPIHWGWPARGIAAQPFLREAAETIERDIVDRYDREVAGMLNRVIG